MSVAVTPNPNVVGPTGPTGPTGVTGTAGVTGATGPTLVGFNTQTGTTYTLVLDDKDKMVTLNNASAITLTVPPSIFSCQRHSKHRTVWCRPSHPRRRSRRDDHINRSNC
jgi:hypothetical protein